MKVVSWDIGIRNLALCVLSSQDKGQTFTIHHWEVIDIAGSTNCSKCEKKATHILEDNPYCNKHLTGKARPPKSTKSSLMKLPKADLLKFAKSIHMPTNMIETMTKPNAVEQILTFMEQRFATPIRKQHASFIPLPTLAGNVVQALNTRKQVFKDATHCIIEQQMKSRMTAIGMSICTHMIGAFNIPTYFVSPKHKLTVGGSESKARTYAQRKKEGVKFASEMISSEYAAYLKSHSKKDDLADSFLQAVWFLRNQ